MAELESRPTTTDFMQVHQHEERHEGFNVPYQFVCIKSDVDGFLDMKSISMTTTTHPRNPKNRLSQTLELKNCMCGGYKPKRWLIRRWFSRSRNTFNLIWFFRLQSPRFPCHC